MDLENFANNQATVQAIPPQAPGAAASVDYRVFHGIPDLLNGAEAAFTYLHVAAGLSAEYHWPNANAMALLPVPTTTAGVRSLAACFATIIRCGLVNSTMPPEVADRFCVVIGLARTAVLAKWRIVDADIEPTQLKAIPTATLALAADRGDTPYVWRAALTGAADAAATNAVHTRMLAAFDDLPAEDRANIYKLSICTPLTAGVTLVFTTVHHFVDPHKQVARAIVGQVLGSDVSTIRALPQDVFEDALFHKTPHPIKAARLMGAARTADFRPKFARMGLGAAVVRVPAEFPPERAVSAMSNVVTQVAGMAVDYNIGIDTTAVLADLRAARAPLANTANAQLILDAQDAVDNVIAVHGKGIAWCVGFLTAMARDNRTIRASLTILRSKALTRVGSGNGDALQAGSDHFTAVMRWKRAAAAEGLLPGASVFGAPAPPTRGLPVAAP